MGGFVLQEMLVPLGLVVADDQLIMLERLVDELLLWNSRRNLTAITEREDVLEKHLVDSLTLLPLLGQAQRLLDIGSGAGFPALPLKVVRPQLEIVSVDSVGKKIDFQKHVVRTLALRGYTALHERVEKLACLPSYRSSFDLVTARAVCSLAELVKLAEPFLTPDGRLLAMKGPEGEHELLSERERLQGDGWLVTLQRLNLPVSGAERCLIELWRT